MTDYKRFIEMLSNIDPADEIGDELKALWYDKKCNWTKAHEIVQNLHGKAAAHIHAYLHRKEGDIWNAKYWYSVAGETLPDLSLDDEWDNLARKFTITKTDLL